MAELTVVWIYLFSICCVYADETVFEVAASPGLQKQKLYQVSLTTNLTWFDAVNDCHNQGYQTLVYTSKDYEKLETVRRSLLSYRGYSDLEIWTGYITNYYSWSNMSELFRVYKCRTKNATEYGIKNVKAGTDQCIVAHLVDQTSPTVSLHADDCLQKNAYVCYSKEDTLVEMVTFTEDVYYNFTYNDYTTFDRSKTTFSDCSATCVTSRYCVAAVFTSDVPQCWHVYSYLEAEVNITLHKGNNTSYTIGIKKGDKVYYSVTHTPAPTSTPETFPCRQSEPSSLLLTPKTSESVAPSTVVTYSESLSLDVAYSSNFQDLPSTEPMNYLFLSAKDDVTSGLSLQATQLDVLTHTTDLMTSLTSSDITTTVIYSTPELDSVQSNFYTLKIFSHYSTFSPTSANQTSDMCCCTVLPTQSIKTTPSTIIPAVLDKRNLSNFRRRYISVKDNRLSSKVIGVCGAVVIMTVVLVVILSDLSVIYRQHIKKLAPHKV